MSNSQSEVRVAAVSRVATPGLDRFFYVLPVATLALLLAIYLVAPEFYLRYILEFRNREHQAVEIFTEVVAVAASGVIAVGAWRLWKQVRAAGAERVSDGVLRGYDGVMIVAVAALATFFFAGEEASWGQTYLKWNTPAGYKEISGETNLHNAKGSPVRLMADVYLLGMFLVLPVVWQGTKVRNLIPRSWDVSVPEMTVALSVIVSYVITFGKKLFRWFATEGQMTDPQGFYLGFLEEVHELKELLVAFALLMYGIHVLLKVRSRSADAKPQAAVV